MNLKQKGRMELVFPKIAAETSRWRVCGGAVRVLEVEETNITMLMETYHVQEYGDIAV